MTCTSALDIELWKPLYGRTRDWRETKYNEQQEIVPDKKDHPTD